MDKPAISFETERLYVRSVVESDKEQYMKLRVATSEIAEAYKNFPEFRDIEWEGELNSPNEIYVVVFLKKKPLLVASASFQHFDTDSIEFGFNVSEQYRNQGIATELAIGMLQTAQIMFPGKAVTIKTDKTNLACRRVAEKCGGVLSRYEPTLAAAAIKTLMESCGNNPSDDEELLRIRKQSTEFIEEYKEGVCVYRFEQKR